MVQIFRSGLSFAALLLLAGSIILMLFVILSGVTNSIPLNRTFFLQVDSSSFPGTDRDVSQWTFFYICGDKNQKCGAAVPALPLGYAWRGGNQGVPEGLTGSYGRGTTSEYYFYLWRFGWVTYLLAFVFNVLGFFMAILAPCSRLASAFSGVITGFALFWFSISAPLMTTTFVKARDEFNNANISSSIGRYAFGFTWGAYASILLAMVCLFLGARSGSGETVTRSSSRGGLFGLGRNKSTQSKRVSLVETESQRRVKDEYS